MRRANQLLIGLVAVVVVFVALVHLMGRIPETSDMANQPSVKAQEAPLLPPLHAIPVHGKERRIDILDADELLKNPVKATLASIDQGKRLYEIHCLVCHGPGARGNGPIARKLKNPPDNLLMEFSQEQSDGYLYTVIREGGAGMPPQAEGLLPWERWAIVNYLRKLQQDARKK